MNRKIKSSSGKETNLKTGFALMIVILVLLGIIFCIPPKEEESFKEELLEINYDISGNEVDLSYDSTNPIVAIYIQKYGSVVMELYPEIAPNTVNNFISLIRQGFYDNNTFHRLMKGFVLQGGDSTGTGSGGPGYYIMGEFSSNGFENPLSHEKWIVSMARATAPDTAGSQFFICLENAATSLDGSYAAFGKVIDGFDILEKIEKSERVVDERSGKLQTNLVLKKALVDLNGREYSEPEIIEQ